MTNEINQPAQAAKEPNTESHRYEVDDGTTQQEVASTATPPPVSSEPKKEEATTETDAKHKDGDEAADNKDERKPNKVSARQRINELTRQYRTEQSVRQKLEAENAELRKQVPAKAADADATEPKKPTRDNYESYDDYVEALTDWKVEQKTKTAPQPQVQQQQKPVELTPEEKALADAVKDVVAEGAEKYPDFTEKLFDQRMPMTQTMAEAIFDSDNAADMAYYLATHHDKAAEIAQLDPKAQIRAIGKLEARMESGELTVAGKQPAPKKVTQAPEPIEPDGAGNSSEYGVTDDDTPLSSFRAKRHQAWKRHGFA